MSDDTTSRPELTSSQVDLHRRIVKAFDDTAKRFADLLCSSSTEEQYPPPWLKQPRRENCLAIWGPRGSGKTTLLEALYHAQQPEVRKKFLLARPIDGSLGPAGIPAGLMLLYRIREEFERIADPQSRLKKRAAEAFAKVEQHYVQGAEGYAELARRLAFSREHFSRIAVDGVHDRLGLPQAVYNWLQAEAERTKVTGAVVLLDDADLMPATLPASLLGSLLDELHQPRLLIVLAADADRLERQIARYLGGMSAGRKPASDELAVARALLYKVVPGTRRFDLSPWSSDERLGFSAPVSAEARKVALSVDEALGRIAVSRGVPAVLSLGSRGPELNSAESDRVAKPQRLGELLESFGAFQDLASLLPPFPRGLENVYRFLQQQLLEMANEAGADRPARTGKNTDPASDVAGARRLRRAYLQFLADARGEFELAGKLRMPEELRMLVPRMLLKRDLSPEEWQGLVEDARDENRPLGALFEPLGHLGVERHSDSAWWQEVLLDEALGGGELTLAHLLVACKPIGERLSLARISTSLFSKSIETWATDRPGTISRVVRHIEWPERLDAKGGTVSVHAGWWPLVTGLFRHRKPWPGALFERELALGISDQERQAIEAGPASPPVPARVRALVRLADACLRGPYAKVRTDQVWQPVELAQVAAGLGVQTFLFALDDKQPLEPPDIKDPKSWLERQIEIGNPINVAGHPSPAMQELARALHCLIDHVVVLTGDAKQRPEPPLQESA